MLLLQHLHESGLSIDVGVGGPTDASGLNRPLEMHGELGLGHVALEGEAHASRQSAASVHGVLDGDHLDRDILAPGIGPLQPRELALEKGDVAIHLLLLVLEEHPHLRGLVRREDVEVFVVALPPARRAGRRVQPREGATKRSREGIVVVRLVLLVGAPVRKQAPQDLHAGKPRPAHEAVEAPGAAVRPAEVRQRMLHLHLVPRQGADLHSNVALVRGDDELGRHLHLVRIELVGALPTQDRPLNQDLNIARRQREAMPSAAECTVELQPLACRRHIRLDPHDRRLSRIVHHDP
mmetsp:Transcript_59243/g.171182  ORF Transcript_59243/g.171182 Transcript_59243/m.171182 type:complete len:294 (-) Transcript_59243:1424-2305(-)